MPICVLEILGKGKNMINSINGSYNVSTNTNKELKSNGEQKLRSQNTQNSSKAQEIKELIQSKQYKIDLDISARSVADALGQGNE